MFSPSIVITGLWGKKALQAVFPHIALLLLLHFLGPGWPRWHLYRAGPVYRFTLSLAHSWVGTSIVGKVRLLQDLPT